MYVGQVFNLPDLNEQVENLLHDDGRKADTLKTKNAGSNDESLTAFLGSPSLQLRANACHHGETGN